MKTKDLVITLAVVAVGAGAAFYFYKKSQAVTVTVPANSTKNAGKDVTDYIKSGTDALDSIGNTLTGLFGSN